jgi:hypothetical protein
MSTIVGYTSEHPAENHYPDRIVSPPRPGACCAREAVLLGAPALEGRSLYQYKRCSRCGFTVRAIQHLLPDAGVVAALQARLSELPFDRIVA